jgi:hypothetical protein
VAAGVDVTPDDLAQVVDAKYLSAIGPQRIVEGGVGAAVVGESVVHASDAISPDDLAQAHVVDAVRLGLRRPGSIDGGVDATAVKEPVIKPGR